jgi:hypothetical protein
MKEEDFHLLDKYYYFKFIKEDLVASLALNPFIFSFFTYYVFSYFFHKNPKILENLIDGKGIYFLKRNWFVGYFAGTGDVLRKSVPQEMLYHFSEHQAQVGLKMLKNFKTHQKKRIENSVKLVSMLSIEAKKNLPNIRENAQNVYWRLPIFVEDTDKIEKKLFEKGIDPGKTTLPCLPSMNIFNFLAQSCPVAEEMGKKTIFIPNFHYLADEKLNFIASIINEYFEEKISNEMKNV